MKLEYWSAWNAFASLQATAKDFAGLNNARLLIREAKNIRHWRYEQIAKEVESAQIETVSENIISDGEGQGLIPAEGLHQAA